MPKTLPRGIVRGEKNLYFAIPGGTSASEVVTDWTPGFAFTIESVKAYVSVVGTGTNGYRLLRVLKGTSTVVASLALLVANVTPLGAELVLAVTAANATFGDADTLTVDFADTDAVAYSAGALSLALVYRQEKQQETA